ncbi:MerR family transcriptional regulator [Enterocloster citroniae]|jgi:DNA-binding transcriptional MerR regulator|uniref:MerR family transcriptional regulator n=1 Tax=Enterocloster citroniae TaxID=358743 RepID=UPI0032C076C3
MKQNMKQINRIKEVSELFHIPSSALRYWDDEGLVRFERTADNNYRRPTSQTMVDICDVMFYRSLSLSIKEIKAIPGMSVEEVGKTLDANAKHLEEQIILIRRTLDKLHTRQAMVRHILEMDHSHYETATDRLPAMKLFASDDKHALEVYVNDPYQTAILIRPETSQETQYGVFLDPAPSGILPDGPDTAITGTILRSADAVPCLYLKGILKVNAALPSAHNARDFVKAARGMGYQTGALAGRYLLTASEGYRCDYYEAWLELL